MLLHIPAARTLKEAPQGDVGLTNASAPSQKDPINQECSGIIVKQAKRLYSAPTHTGGGTKRWLSEMSSVVKSGLQSLLLHEIKTFSISTEDGDIGGLKHVLFLALPSHSNYHG